MLVDLLKIMLYIGKMVDGLLKIDINVIFKWLWLILINKVCFKRIEWIWKLLNKSLILFIYYENVYFCWLIWCVEMYMWYINLNFFDVNDELYLKLFFMFYIYVFIFVLIIYVYVFVFDGYN